MPHGNDVDDSLSVLNLVENPVIPDSNPPKR